MEEGYPYNQEEVSPIYVPVWKFALLAFFTFGLYDIYYFYKSWHFFKYHENEDLMPIWRAIFGPLFLFSLARRMAHLAGKTSTTEADTASVIFFILNIAYRLPEPYFLIGFFAFIPLIPVVNNQNAYIEKEYDNFEEYARFTGGEVVVLILGIILTGLIVLGTLAAPAVE